MSDIINLDLVNVEPAGGRLEYPAGLYLMVIAKAEVGMNSAGTGQVIKVRFKIEMGPGVSTEYVNKPFTRSYSTGDTARAFLKRFLLACGVTQLSGSWNVKELVGRRIVVELAVKDGNANIVNEAPASEFSQLLADKGLMVQQAAAAQTSLTPLPSAVIPQPALPVFFPAISGAAYSHPAVPAAPVAPVAPTAPVVAPTAVQPAAAGNGASIEEMMRQMAAMQAMLAAQQQASKPASQEPALGFPAPAPPPQRT